MRKEVEFLGHLITAEGVESNPAKVERLGYGLYQRRKKMFVNFWELSGTIGYYRRFIRDFAEMANS